MCHISCKTCFRPNSLNWCTSCFEPPFYQFIYFLAVANPSEERAGQCVSACPQHFYTNQFDNVKECHVCHQICATCYGAHLYNCLSCAEGYYLGSESRCIKLQKINLSYQLTSNKQTEDYKQFKNQSIYYINISTSRNLSRVSMEQLEASGNELYEMSSEELAEGTNYTSGLYSVREN